MLRKIIRWATNNFGLKILAILFAFVLWLAVVNIDDPTTTKTFAAVVSIENGDYLTQEKKYFEVINNSNMVTFKASGKRSYLERMSNLDFKASADLKMMEKSNRVPIEITPQRYGGYVTVIGKMNYLELSVENLIDKSFLINVETEGEVGKQHAIGETISAPTLLRITGPASVVEKIKKVKAIVNVEGMLKDLSDSVTPIAYDKNNRKVDIQKVSFNTQNIMVSVKILDTKEVELNFQTMGTLPEGYGYVGMEYKPKKVMVKGTAAVLNTVNDILVPAEVLDLTNATDGIQKEVDISSYLPEGVGLVDSKQSKVFVEVKIEKRETRAFEMPTANITVSNLGEKYDVEFVTETISIELDGMASELNQLDAASLTGSIDVGGMMAGRHTVNLTLNLDNQLKLSKSAAVAVDIVPAGGGRHKGVSAVEPDTN